MSHANEAQLYLAQIPATKPIEDLNEDQLVGQRVRKPENHFVVLGKSRERLFTRFYVFPRLLQGHAVTVSDEAGTGFAPCFRVKTGGRRPFVHQITVR